MTLALLIVSAILFLLAAIPPVARGEFVPLGLFFWVLSIILGHTT